MEKKTTTRCERILAAFAHLKEKGLVKTQQDVADMMGANKTTVSQAFKGSEKYLSDKFLARFNATFNDMFNIGWLITGKGDIGHGGHSVTDIYIDFDQRKVDDANRRVIDWVLYGRK